MISFKVLFIMAFSSLSMMLVLEGLDGAFLLGLSYARMQKILGGLFLVACLSTLGLVLSIAWRFLP